MASAYSAEQISEYLHYVRLPPSWHPSAHPARSLEYLTILHAHQISTIPYENLSLHYSKTKDVNIDPQFLFDKLVRRRRGGYCLETSIFYYHVLRALGFDVYMTGVRIRYRKDGVPVGEFAGLHHIVNLVTINSQTYMIDVGFGGDGATVPVPLMRDNGSGSGDIEGDRTTANIGTQEIRLIQAPIPDAGFVSGQPFWHYQYRNGPDRDWNSYYAFTETEFGQKDFDIMNWWLVTHPDCFQRYMVLVILFLRHDDDDNGQLGVDAAGADADAGAGTGNGNATVVLPNGTSTTTTATATATSASPHVDDDHDGVKRTINRRRQVYGKRMLVDGVVKENVGGKTKIIHTCQTEAERRDALKRYFGLELTQEEADGIKGHVTELKG